MDLTRQLRDYIRQHGIKLNFVAQKAGIPKQRFYGIMSGRMKLRADEFVRVCDALNVDPKFFIECVS